MLFLFVSLLGLAVIPPMGAAARPENLVPWGRVSASSSASAFEGKYGPPRAADGDFSSHWASADAYALPQWFQVDFPEPQTVDTVFIHAYVQPDLYDAWQAVELSLSDGESIRRSLGPAESELEFRFPARPVAWIRLTILASYTHSHYLGIDEFRAFFDPDRRVKGRVRPVRPKPRAALEVQGREEHPIVYINRYDLERAQRNIARHDWARQARDQIVSIADTWLRETEEYWLKFLPEPGACYAYGFTGCPLCGQPWGTWGSAQCHWDNPGHVTCRNGHILPDADHPDDGSGYHGSDGRIHYFVGSWNAWVTEQWTLNALPYLAWAYALTGQERYAERAAFFLDALASIYPESTAGSWDYPSSPPSGRLARPWYQVARNLVVYVDAYDLIYHSPVLDQPSLRPKQEATWPPGPTRQSVAVGTPEAHGVSRPDLTRRENIELNLMQDAAYYCYANAFSGHLHNGHADYLRGALAVGCLLGIPEYVHHAIDSPYSIYAMLANNVDRDGRYYETALGYALHTRDLYLTFAGPLRNWRDPDHPHGINLYDDPLFRSFYLMPDTVMDCAGHAPNFGDAGPDHHFAPPKEPRYSASDYRYAEEMYAGTSLPDQRSLFAAILAYLTRGDLNQARTSLGRGAWLLFHAEEPWEEGERERKGRDSLPPELARKVYGSWFMGQKGIGVLRTRAGEDAQAALLRYGPSLNHGDFDDLGLLYYACGWQLTYEIGYGLGSTHTQVGWGSVTASHCLVVVDEANQLAAPGSGGSLHLFAATPGLQLIEASSENSYRSQKVLLYRRTVALIGEGSGKKEAPYLLDIFRVTGGGQHDYVLGAQTQQYTVDGIELGPEEEGSLAEGVAWGEKIGNDGDIQGYPNKPYWNPPPGNGYGFFYDIRRASLLSNPSTWRVTWPLGGPTETSFRLHFLSEPNTEPILAKAPGLYPANANASYVLARRRGTVPLTSTFVTVMEPYTRNQPFLAKVEPLLLHTEAPAGNTSAVEPSPLSPVGVQVTRRDGTVDVLLSASLESGLLRTDTALGPLEMRGAFARVTGYAGRITQVILHGADRLKIGKLTITAEAAAFQGTVRRIDEDRNVIFTDTPLPPGDSLRHQAVIFSNRRYSRTTGYSLDHIEATPEGSALHLGQTRLVLGQGHVLDIVDNHTLLSDVPHEYARSVNGLSHNLFFDGKRVTNGRGAATNLREVHFGPPMKLVVDSTEGFEVDDRLFYHDLQPGDTWTIPTTVVVTLPAEELEGRSEERPFSISSSS